MRRAEDRLEFGQVTGIKDKVAKNLGLEEELPLLGHAGVLGEPASRALTGLGLGDAPQNELPDLARQVAPHNHYGQILWAQDVSMGKNE